MKSEQVHKEPYLCNRHRSGVGLSAVGGERERERKRVTVRCTSSAGKIALHAGVRNAYACLSDFRFASRSSGNLHGVSDLFRFWHAARANRRVVVVPGATRARLDKFAACQESRCIRIFSLSLSLCRSSLADPELYARASKRVTRPDLSRKCRR